MIGAGLTGVYTFLYITLRQQDYALLTGAIALFIVLAIVMYVTRRVGLVRARRELKLPKNTPNSRDAAQGMKPGWNPVRIALLDVKSCQLLPVLSS
jgi:hypothetical protein